MQSPQTATDRVTEAAPPWITLLERFYRRAGAPVPELTLLQANQLPKPYRQLLAHSTDMTPALENHYRQQIGLAVVQSERAADFYLRETVLMAAGGTLPVLYGVIRIHLDRLTPDAASQVVAEQRPFGSILQQQQIAHRSSPEAFFTATADPHISALLRLEPGLQLYGRYNILSVGSGAPLAEVVELLTPAAHTGAMLSKEPADRPSH